MICRFTCGVGRFSKDRDERKIEATMPFGAQEYRVTVRTGYNKHAATSANVWLQIQGTEGDTQRMHLNKDTMSLKGTPFKQGASDEFVLKVLSLWRHSREFVTS